MKRLPHLLAVGAVVVGLIHPALAQDRREIVKRCRELLKAGIEAYDEARYPEALKNLEEILGQDPKNADGYYWQGKVFLAQEDTLRAADALVAGTTAAPLSSRIKILLARVRLAQGNPTDANDLVASVLAIKPNQGEALYLRGLVFLDHGDTTAALDDWNRSLELAKGRER